MSNMEIKATDISVETPLIYSHPLSLITGREILLKLENVQPSGSFKLRGISHMCVEKFKEGNCKKFVCVSGGGAALACAYAAFKLNVPVHIFIPQSVSPRILNRLYSFNAQVTKVGKNYAEANEVALEECKNDPSAVYIPAYSDPLIWDGHAQIIVSLKEQLKGRKPICICVAVGGGGLLSGLLNGLDLTGWQDIPMLAMETIGADCFNLSIKAGRLIEKAPTSIAKCLGASSVVPALMERLPNYKIISHVVPDKVAADATIRFADDHGFLVEPACGACLASSYSKILPNILQENGFKSDGGPIVIIVCGGSDITPSMLREYANMFDL